MLVIVLATASVCPAQQPQLAISAPADGAVFNPGQTITVTVTSPANVSFNSVGVIGEGPFGLSNLATAVPAQFSFTVPSNALPGKYMLTADGTTTSGQTVTSAPILVDIERPDLPMGLKFSSSNVVFAAAGQTTRLNVFATFSDGTVLNVGRSSYIVFTSSNTSVATVSGDGTITAVCAGIGSVNATYTFGGNGVQTSIPVHGPSSLVFSPSALGFSIQTVGTNSPQRTITLINGSNSPINVQGVTTTGDFSRANLCSLLQPGATCSIGVTFTPTAVGIRTGTVHITNDSCQASLTIPLTGTGMSDFSVSVTPTTQSVTVGGSINYTVSVTPLGGFANAVALSLAGLPSNTTASFTPTSISSGSGSSTLKVTASSKTPVGTYTLTITGTSGNLVHTKTATLVVNARH